MNKMIDRREIMAHLQLHYFNITKTIVNDSFLATQVNISGYKKW